MDFHEILSVAAKAQKDNEVKASHKKVFSTKLSAPKKLERDKVDPSAIKAMLARKAKDKEQKEAKDKARKEHLLKLRSDANHSRMAHAMATRTKDNLKILTKKDVEKIKKERPSKEKSEEDVMHDNFMKKLERISSRSTEKAKRNEQKINELLEGPQEKKALPKKPRGPPINGPMDFKELMKVAATKQHEPVSFAKIKSIPIPKKKKPEEIARPLTQKEKDEIKHREERTKSKEYQTWYKTGKKPPPKITDQIKSKDKPKTSSHSEQIKKPKKNNELINQKLASSNTKPSSSKREHSLPRPQPTSRPHPTSTSKISEKGAQNEVVKKKTLNMAKIAMANNGLKRNSDVKVSPHVDTKNKTSKKYAQTNSNVLVCRPQKDVPSNPWDRIMGPMQRHKERPMKRHIIDSDSEESDEDLEGFIDDDDNNFIDDSGDVNYSKHIQEIFGYNKRKWAHYDEDDVDNMESSFTQQMKEEARSTKLGILEDLEDIRREEEEEKMKKMQKKVKGKRR